MNKDLFKNSDYMKNIQMFSDYADYLVDLNRDKYIAMIIMARAMRTIIDPKAKIPDLKDNESKLYWVHQCILEFVIKNKEINADWFLNRICMLPAATEKDKIELQETINNIRKSNK